jgi:Ca-activated chloride channel homolog
MRVAMLLALVASTAVAAPKKHEPGALVLVIDRSGSMQGPKLEAAKKATLAAIATLHPDDTVTVIAFDSESTVYVKPQPAANKKAIEDDLKKLLSGGGTNIFPGLKEAYELLQTQKVKTKHVILLSDGEAPYDGLPELVDDMVASKITISTVAVPGADEKLLDDISKRGLGRAYKVSDMSKLAPTFVKETQLALLK